MLLADQGVMTVCDDSDQPTNVLHRMYENNTVPVSAPERFRVEISFSPGAAYDPTELIPRLNNHVLPVVPRVEVNQVRSGTRDVPLFSAAVGD